MDVTMMPYIADAAPPAQPQKPSGKTDAGTGDEGGGFAGVMAGAMADTPGGGGEKKVAADDSSGDQTGPPQGMPAGMIPGMWSFVPLMPTVMNAGQAQNAAEGTSAIAPLTATGMQATTQLDAARGQTLTGAQAALPDKAGADLVPQLTQQNEQNQQNQLPSAAASDPNTATDVSQPTQTAAPGVQVITFPAMPNVPAATAPQPTATAEVTPTAAAEENATAPQPAVIASPQVATAETATAAQVLTAAVKPQAAPTDKRTENMPQAEAGSLEQAAAPAMPVPPTAAMTQAQTGDGDTALTADTPATAPEQQAAVADSTPSANVFAALVDQRTAPAATDVTQTASAAQQPANADPNNIAGQIVDHARLITRPDNSEMVIKLKPEHLGELTLKIAVENGAVKATFHTPNADVRSAIEASLPQLRQDMASQGLKVDYVGVYTSLDHFFANDQRHAPQQQQLNTVQRQSGDESFTEAVAAAATLPGTQTASGGIDYRV